MKTIEPKPSDELSVVAFVRKTDSLVDRRLQSAGIIFGTVEQVAAQYGIKISACADGRCLKFTAPKSRLQIFVEKLHFSKARYFEE